MRIFILLYCALFAVSAQAQNITQRVELCHVLDKHVPDDDVTYKPGVDVKGNAVAPADLNGGSDFELPETIKIPLTINLAEEFDIDGEYTEDSLNAPLGMIEVRMDGAVIYNGQDISSQAMVYCEESHRQSE